MSGEQPTMADVIADSLAEWPAEDSAEEHAVRVAAALSAAGFGPVREARAGALEEAAQELARLEYKSPFHPDRAEYERVLAVRRGNADGWLRARAAAERGQG